MNAKKKLMISLASMCVVVVAMIVAIVSVLAAKTTSAAINDITISYKSNKVNGTFEVDYTTCKTVYKNQSQLLMSDGELLIANTVKSSFGLNASSVEFYGDEQTGQTQSVGLNLTVKKNEAMIIRFKFSNRLTDTSGRYSVYDVKLSGQIASESSSTSSNIETVKIYTSEKTYFDNTATEVSQQQLSQTGLRIGDEDENLDQTTKTCSAEDSAYVYLVILVNDFDLVASYTTSITWNMTGISLIGTTH